MVSFSTPEPLRFTRFFKPPPEVVFSLWTNPDSMRRWFRPSKEIRHPFLTVDFRVGGMFRVGFQGTDGVVDILRGEFLEITPPHRLVYTWEWEPPNEHAGISSLVTVQFNGKDGGTELSLCHAISDAGMKDRHSHGWSGALELLDELLARVQDDNTSEGERLEK